MTDKNTQSTAALLLNLEAHNVDRIAAIKVADDIAAKTAACDAGTIESLQIITATETAEWNRVYGWQALAAFYCDGEYTKAAYDRHTARVLALVTVERPDMGVKSARKWSRVGPSIGVALRHRCSGDIAKLRGMLCDSLAKNTAYAEYTSETLYKAFEDKPLQDVIAAVIGLCGKKATPTLQEIATAFHFDAKTGGSNYKGFMKKGAPKGSVPVTEQEEGDTPSGDEVTQGDKEGLTPAMCRTALLELIKQYDVNVAYDELSRVYRELTMARERAQADADEATAKGAATAAKRAARKLATAAA
jgi:hypothetical protein